MQVYEEQRWREREPRWVRPGGRVLFEPEDHFATRIGEKTARAFVEAHHYSGSFPSQRRCVGLFERRCHRLVGVAAFSIPAQQAVIPKWTGHEDRARGTELGRFVLLDEVGYNAETWFASKAFRVLKEDSCVESVVSYSDPVERRSLEGEVIKPGHIGTIYKGLGALFKGRSRARTLLLRPDGTTLSERSLFKIRPRLDGTQDKGFTRAWEDIRRFLPDRWSRVPPTREQWADFRCAVFEDSNLRRLHSPGNLVYVWHLRGARKREDTVSLPYPSREVIVGAS